MLFLVVLAGAVLTVPLCGGRFSHLAQVHLRAPWSVVLALAVQIVTISVLVQPPHALAAGLHLLSYGLAAVFLWANRRLPGLPVVAAGGAANLLAIALNAGTMPASASALRTAGITNDHDHFANSTTVASPHLSWLGDVFAVPHTAGWLANVFSPGDVVLTVGAVWLVHAASGASWPDILRPGAPAADEVVRTGGSSSCPCSTLADHEPPPAR